MNEDHKAFLDGLRESGATNMWGAVPYLMAEFPQLDRHMAKDIVAEWMRGA
jgi:hypothetical protein